MVTGKISAVPEKDSSGSCGTEMKVICKNLIQVHYMIYGNITMNPFIHLTYANKKLKLKKKDVIWVV
jgi:hypothetical protein